MQTVSKLVLEMRDPKMGFVTITGASAAPDLALVKITYSVLGTAEEKTNTAEVFQKAKSFFRRELGQLENLRKVPDIMFIYDAGIEYADRVNRIINKIHIEEGPNDETPASD